MSTEYLTWKEKQDLDRLTYEHRVLMAKMDARLKELKKEAKVLRWQLRLANIKRFFGG